MPQPRSVVMRLPVQPFMRALLLRSAGIWAGARLMLALGGIPVGAPLLTLRTSVVAVILVAVLVLIDVRRRKEEVLLANLGVSRGTILAVAAVPAVCLEALLLLGIFYGTSWL